jgi:dienelactone hydrolase
MVRSIGLFVAALIAGCSGDPPDVAKTVVIPKKEGTKTQVQFAARDGRKVYADFYKTAKGSDTIILLFHQAGSNAHEYETIAPKLLEMGYDSLAVDQRSGGEMWGRKNRTGDLSNHYMDAYRDMQGALEWAKSKNYGHIVAWGSSYSASLVLKLAVDNKDVEAVLAFSPGEYFGGTVVKDWNMRVAVPVLMAMTPDEANGDGLLLYEASSHTPARTHGDMFVSFPDSVHGSSTLREDRNPKGWRKTWQQVTSFLKANAKAKSMG